MSDSTYYMTSTPHTSSPVNTQNIMKHVIIALLPATLMGVYIFGMSALLVILVSVASCVIAEYAYNKALGKKQTAGDLSAALTGLLLAMNLPSSVPMYVPVVGSIFAIIVVKQLFGGIGQNIVNPALAARAFLLVSYPTEMTTWPVPFDAVTGPTPLALLKTGQLVPGQEDYISAFVGTIGGCIGETCAIGLILGGLYLLFKGIINWRTPVFYIGTVFILSSLLRQGGMMIGLYDLIVGGLMLGAFFMATDYTTSPVTYTGKIIMGIGCGILTVVIRVYGGYPEGVSYSILLMNLIVPLIDRFVRPKVFGVSREKKKEAKA